MICLFIIATPILATAIVLMRDLCRAVITPAGGRRGRGGVHAARGAR